MSEVQLKNLKKNGFLPQKQQNRFSLRLRVAGGKVTAKQLQKVYDIAAVYGQGYIHMTSRQSIEIPFIKLEDIEIIRNELAASGLEPAAGGARVRTVTACQGNAVCSHGLIDTTALAEEFDMKYYGRDLPHKFKLGITGCRNNCLKAEENDLGVKGGMRPEWQQAMCTFCGACEKVCRGKAIQVDKSAQTLAFDQTKCCNCGKCVKICPTKAWQGTRGFVVYFGGLFGNRITIGKQLLPLLESKEELHRVVEATLEFFAEHATPGERFANTLDRVGWELLKDKLVSVRS